MADFTPIGVGTSANDGTGDTLRMASQLINANWVLTPKLDHAKAYTAPQSFYPGTASAPGVYFVGDSNTGIFWYQADTLSFTAGGINRLDITTTAINSALPYRSSATGSAGVPIFSFFGDTDTGIWSSAADTLSFAAGGVNRADLSGTAFNIAVPVRNSAGGNAAAPDYSFFGDTDTGIYRIGADSIGLATGGTLRKTIDTAAETNTLPTLGPAGSASAPAFSFSGDSNTGIYNVGADQLGIATGGTLRRTIGTSAETVTLPQQGADGSASAPQYTFSADTDNGLYRAGTNNPAIAAGGSQVMSFSTTGNLQPLQPCFQARKTSATSNATGDGTTVTMVGDTETFDQGANHNTGTGVFTAPVTGRYLLGGVMTFQNIGGGHTTIFMRIVTSNRNYESFYQTQSNSGTYQRLPVMVIADMDAGDTAYMEGGVSGGTKSVTVDGNGFGHCVSTFYGALLH